MILDDIKNNLDFPLRVKQQYSFIAATDKKMSSKLTKMLNQDEPKTLYNEEGHDDDCTATTLR